MRKLNVGIISDATNAPRGLTRAVLDQPGITPYRLESGAWELDKLDAVVVDVPLDRREKILAQVAGGTAAPVLIQMPVATTVGNCRELAERFEPAQLTSLNPLRYDTSLSRLIQEVTESPDRIETIYASWRCQADAATFQNFAQFIDLVSAVANGIPAHASAVRRASPSVLLAVLTHETGVLTHLEFGELLASSVARDREVMIECFGREHAYQCRPDAQSITIEHEVACSTPWWPDPFSSIVSAFVEKLGAPSSFQTGGPLHDAEILAACEAIQALG